MEEDHLEARDDEFNCFSEIREERDIYRIGQFLS